MAGARIAFVFAVAKQEQHSHAGEQEPEMGNRWWVEGILPRAVPVILGGPPKSAKSLFMLQLGICIASGQEFFGRQTTPGRVLVLALEDARADTQSRLWQICRAFGLTPGDLEGKLAVSSEKAFFFAKVADRVALEATLDAYRPDVVIIDSFARVFSGDENSKEAAQIATIPWQELCRDREITVALIHHFKKSSRELDGSPIPLGYRLRGTSDLFAFVRHIVGIEKIQGKTRKAFSLSVEGNCPTDLEPFTFEIQETSSSSGKGLRLVQTGTVAATREVEIEVALLAGPQDTTSLCGALHRRREHVIAMLSELESQGRITRSDGPRSPWILTTKK